jgi:hypothetical protein
MNTLKLSLIVCAIAISEIAISQPVIRNNRSIADSLRDEGDIPSALVEYKKIYIQNPKDQPNVYNYACALSINKQIDSSFKYLYIAVEMDTSVASLIDPDFLTIREDRHWQDFENKLISMLNIKFKKPFLDIEYAKSLWKLRALDQAYFNEIGIAGSKIGMKSSVVEALWKFKFMIQKNNQIELEGLIALKGWPKIRDVGSEAAMGAYLVAIHSNDGSQKKYLPIIKQRCEENELSWQRYANIYDRCLFNENRPQKYGTHTRFNESTKSEELYPLEDETKVDEWRKEIGLEPLAEYLAKFNIKFQSK